MISSRCSTSPAAASSSWWALSLSSSSCWRLRSSSAVFALIAFQLSLGRLLPPVSYLTRADQFLQGSTVLVFLALSEAIFTGRLARRNREALANRINRWAVVVYLALFGTLLIFTTS